VRVRFRLLYVVLVALPTLRLVQGARTWPFLLWAGVGWLIALVALAVYAKRHLSKDPAPKTDLRLPKRFHVPTGRVSPTGEEPKLFDGSREQWNALTDQERRYALVNMSEEEQIVLSPPLPTSKEELDEKYGDWTNERLEEETAFHAQIAQYLSEIVAHFEWRTDLDPADAEDRKAIEKESERLFGAEPTLYVPSEPA
jgi:hypothetical protein